MSPIDALRARLDEAQTQLARLQHEAGPSPSFADSIFIRSMESQVTEFGEQLQALMQRRGREVVMLHFEGRGADGSLPLGPGTDMLNAFRDAVTHAAYFFSTGRHRATRIPDAIIDQLGLRLRRLEAGSTKVYITGEVAADLFGSSLIEQSLDATFDVLEAADEEELSAAVSRVGALAAHQLQAFLQKAQAIGYRTVRAEWDTPRDSRRSWVASRAKVGQLRSSLGSFEFSERPFAVTGTVGLLSRHGRVEIDAGGTTYACDFPQALLEVVRPFHIGDRVTARILESKAVNRATGRERTSYTLLTLRDPEAFARHGLDPEA